MRKKLWAATAVTALGLSVVGIASVAADHAGGHVYPTSAEGITPDLRAGNEGAGICALYGGGSYVKFDPPNEVNNGTFTTTKDGVYLSWAATGVTVNAVIVKGGPNFHVYDYQGSGITSDSWLASPLTGSGNIAAISHYSFCYGDGPGGGDDELTVAKTAAGSYDRTITWTLDKSVDPDSHSGGPGDEFESDYTIVVDKSETTGNYSVSGTITVLNPFEEAVDVTISDVLADGDEGIPVTGITCDVEANEDDTFTVPAEGTLDCTYEHTLGGTHSGVTANTVTITWGDGGTASDTAPVTFEENVIGSETADLSDDVYPDQNESGLTDDVTKDYTGDFECPTDRDLYEEVDGKLVYQEVVTNTATLTFPGSDDDPLTDSATVTVTCEANEDTAFAKADGGDTCFIDDPAYNFSRWGWTNLLEDEGEFSFPLYAGAGQCDLSKGAEVGTVEVDWTDDTLTVTYNVNEGVFLLETHLHVGYNGDEMYPTTTSGSAKKPVVKETVAPGQYEFGGTSSTYVVDVTGSTELWIIAHAVVWGTY